MPSLTAFDVVPAHERPIALRGLPEDDHILLERSTAPFSQPRRLIAAAAAYVATTADNMGTPPVAGNQHHTTFPDEADNDSGAGSQRHFCMLTWDSATDFDDEDPGHVAAKEAYYNDDENASINTLNSHIL